MNRYCVHNWVRFRWCSKCYDSQAVTSDGQALNTKGSTYYRSTPVMTAGDAELVASMFPPKDEPPELDPRNRFQFLEIQKEESP